MWISIDLILRYFADDPIHAFALILKSNFEFDIINFFINNKAITLAEFLSPQILAWLFVGFVSGAIAKGLKRGFIAGSIVVVINLLMWIIVSVIAQEDVFSYFQETMLFITIGGILSAFLAGIIGGIIGGIVSGPYEEFI
ncbi:MAG: hypothetical protein ACTSQJ_01480 [Promethearchaeota archaeon]